MESQPKPEISQLNRKHRDTMFRGLFKIPQNFLHLLECCSEGESTLTVNDITPFDLESAVALRIRRNDVSFITKDNRLIILIEHQSTLCPNMALRLFLYYVELLQLWIKTNEVDIYTRQKVTGLPVPEFYVAYNGSEQLEHPFSTFGLEYTGVKIEVTVKIVDIHFEKLEDMAINNALAGYSYFYKVYDESIKQGIPSQNAFTIAREECLKRGYLQGFIDKEDFVMFYKDILDYDTQLKAEGRAEGRAEGKAEGKAEGLLEAAARLLKKGADMQYIVEALHLSDSQVAQLKKLIA